MVTMSNISGVQIVDAKETYLALLELSMLMDTELDPECLPICVRLLEAGANPDALATVIRELRRAVSHVNTNEEDVTNQNSLTHPKNID